MIYFNTYRNIYGIIVEHNNRALILPNTLFIEFVNEETRKELLDNCNAMSFNQQEKNREYNIYDDFVEKARYILAKMILINPVDSDMSIYEFINSFTQDNYELLKDEIEEFKLKYITSFKRYDCRVLDNICDTNSIFCVMALLSI